LLTPPVPSSETAIEVDALVIGAGQAGLAAAYYLQKRGASFQLLDAASVAGAAWAARYDSLRLFSPAWASGLPGWPWPGNPLRYPTRDEASAYLSAYAAHFDFPLDTGQRVNCLAYAPGKMGYTAQTATGRTYLAQRVLIATGPYTAPWVPDWGPQVPSQVTQVHSRDYRRPAQLPGAGPVAVVGSGNSALQIAADLATTGRPVWVAFDEKTPAVPNNQFTWASLAATRLLRVPRHTALGRWMHSQPEPVVSGDLARLRACTNVIFMGRAIAARPDRSIQGQQAVSPPLEAIVWATGYRPSYNWVDLPIIGSDGYPLHKRGLTEVPGVAFLGLDWLNSRSSALLHGAGADAKRIVSALF
jgi:putative flavoprotein involved in K+ transport